MIRFLILTVFFFAAFKASAHWKDQCEVTPELNEKAHAFMVRHNMIKPTEESEQPTFSSRWTLTDAKVIHGRCALVMDLCMTMDSQEYCEGHAYEVLAYIAGRVTFFERLFPPPIPLRVGIGNRDDNLYYVQLSGKSAISAWKTIVLKLQYSGLMAKISAKNVQDIDGRLYGEPDGKFSFDPTEGRTWKLKEATWSLRRGMTIEILDVYSYQLDEDFLGYFSGSRGEIGPWTSLIYRYYSWPKRKWIKTGIEVPALQ